MRGGSAMRSRSGLASRRRKRPFIGSWGVSSFDFLRITSWSPNRSSPAAAIACAAEAREAAFYADHLVENERHWLEHSFRAVAALPGGAMLFDEQHNPLFRWAVSSDAAKALVAFWRKIDPETGRSPTIHRRGW